MEDPKTLPHPISSSSLFLYNHPWPQPLPAPPRCTCHYSPSSLTGWDKGREKGSGLRQRAQFSMKWWLALPLSPAHTPFILNSDNLLPSWVPLPGLQPRPPPHPLRGLQSQMRKLDTRWCHDHTIPTSLPEACIGKGEPSPGESAVLHGGHRH